MIPPEILESGKKFDLEPLAAQEKHHAMCHVKVLLEQIFPHQIFPCVIGL